MSWHEYGHFLAKRIYGRTDLNYAYYSAVKADGVSVSAYGDSSIAEDFAEAFRVYFATDGGSLDPKSRDLYHNRFQIIDKIVKANPDSIAKFMSKYYAEEAEALKRRRFLYILVGGGGVVGLFVSGAQIHVL